MVRCPLWTSSFLIMPIAFVPSSLSTLMTSVGSVRVRLSSVPLLVICLVAVARVSWAALRKGVPFAVVAFAVVAVLVAVVLLLLFADLVSLVVVVLPLVSVSIEPLLVKETDFQVEVGDFTLPVCGAFVYGVMTAILGDISNSIACVVDKHAIPSPPCSVMLLSVPHCD